MLTIVETRSAPKTPTEPAVAGSFEPVHCRKCKRMLFRTTVKALRSGEMVETKCPKCGSLNYLVGSTEIVVDNN